MRVVITLLAIAIGLVFMWAVYTTGGPHDAGSRLAQERADTQANVSNPDAVEAVHAVEPHTAAPGAPADSDQDPPPPAIEGLRTRPAETASVSTIGSTDPSQGYCLKAQLTGWGAAVRHIWLARYNETAVQDQPYVIQNPIEAQDAHGRTVRLYPFAARSITVNGQTIDLERQRWQLVEPGAYRLELVDAQDQPVLSLHRHYRVQKDPAPYDLVCHQWIENHSPGRLRVVWDQYAQGDVPDDDAVYLGDRRSLVAGYYDPDYNPTRQFVYTKGAYLSRQKVLDQTPFWDGNEDLPPNRQLVWMALVNRYFGAVVHRAITDRHTTSLPGSSGVVAPLDGIYRGLGMVVVGQPGNTKDDPQKLALTLTSKPLDIPAGQRADLSLALYAGPRSNEVFKKAPYDALGFSKLVIYELGCTLCTFQPLAKGLLGFLKVIHLLVRDWGVAIIILVLCVRLLLHPITKRAQVNMFKMGKQMQSLQPEIEKLKKKYKDDQKKFQQEQLKLWREKGINPVNMLGCLPMFLQTPIWIALYAMLYLAIELRHEPAFYGLFQGISGGRWQFLADLSSPDNFLRFGGEGYRLNLGFIQNTFTGVNLLPLLMAVVFYFQQKLTTPPPANEQAAQQQKMMKFMVLLFPFMLYSAPSGLTLYILASTFAGIVDSYLVRKHVREEEEAGRLFEKKPAKPGGFMDRMHKAIESKQRQLTQQKNRQGHGTTKRRSR